MSKSFNLAIKGIEEVSSIFKDLPLELNKAIMQKTALKAGDVAKKTMKPFVPNKRLANKIRVRKSDTGTGAEIGFGRNKPMASWLEFGTVQRFLKGRGKYRSGVNRGSVKPTPFFVNASTKGAEEALEYMEDNFLKIILKVINTKIRKLS